jgi:hypothetical protein
MNSVGIQSQRYIYTVIYYDLYAARARDTQSLLCLAAEL